MSHYFQGDIVKASRDISGMKRGTRYKIVKVKKTRNNFGTLVDYELRPVHGKRKVCVVPLHVMMRSVNRQRVEAW